ncbi:MAG: lipopolysaccharide biosynthesis protein [Phycisphaerae bacterium]
MNRDRARHDPPAAPPVDASRAPDAASEAAGEPAERERNAAGPTGSSLSVGLGGVWKNALANIGGELVFVATGFLLPRLIADHIGKEMLGVWDFAWSLNAHFMLVGGGMMTSVGREVAALHVRRDWDGLSALVSSCCFLFGLCGLVVLLLAAGTAASLHWLLPTLDAQSLPAARGTVFLLGLCIAFRFPLHVFNGILTGHQRYVLHNLIVSGCHLATTLAVIGVVLAGGGLIWMAAFHLAGELVAGQLKLHFARRIDPYWRAAPRFVRRRTMGYVVRFGGKSFLFNIAQVMLYQTNAVLVGRFLGLEALAVFSRARALVAALEKLVRKAAVVLIPNASALQERGDGAASERLLRRAGEFSLMVALPGVLFLVFLGGPLMNVWMGAGFHEVGLLALLAIGHFASLTQRGSYFILLGRGAHGAPGAATAIGAVAGILLSLLLLGPLKMGLLGAAIAIVVPITIVDGLVIPRLACRSIGVGLRRYAWTLFRRALPLTLALAAVFGAIRAAPLGADWLVVGLGGAATLAVYAFVFRDAIGRSLRGARRRSRAGHETRPASPRSAPGKALREHRTPQTVGVDE